MIRIKLITINFFIFTFIFYSFNVYANDFTKPNFRVIVDNVSIDSREAILVNNIVHVPVRPIAEMFGASVDFRDDISGVLIKHNERVFMPTSRIVNARSYIDLKYIEMIFGYTIEFFSDKNLLHISTNGQRFNLDNIFEIIPSFNGYSKQDLYWLSRLIYAEARGESFEGMLAVGSVVINRMYHYSYPDTVHEVIFDRRNGVQFSPTANGTINNSPSLKSFIAAVEVLEGKRNAGDALFFMNPRIASTNWISNNRSYAFTLQNHSFFY